METKYGLPLVNAQNFEVVIDELGVKSWPRTREPMILEEYLKGNLTDEERGELRFAPKTEVVFLEDPLGKEFRGFRPIFRHGVTVFTMSPEDMVIIVADFRHGTEELSLSLPSGTPTRMDMNFPYPMEVCGKREFQEETGFELEKLIPLSPQGIAVHGRPSNQKQFPFLGVVKKPLVIHPEWKDEKEFLTTFLMPLQDWYSLLPSGLVLEYSLTATYLALKQLGRLRLV